eukprot:6406647-Amphidinium_carterae.1
MCFGGSSWELQSFGFVLQLATLPNGSSAMMVTIIVELPDCGWAAGVTAWKDECVALGVDKIQH